MGLMRQPACFVLLLTLLISKSFAAEGPQVTITISGDIPQIHISEKEQSCPAQPINDRSRQRIVDMAAHEWSDAKMKFGARLEVELVGRNIGAQRSFLTLCVWRGLAPMSSYVAAATFHISELPSKDAMGYVQVTLTAHMT